MSWVLGQAILLEPGRKSSLPYLLVSEILVSNIQAGGPQVGGLQADDHQAGGLQVAFPVV